MTNKNILNLFRPIQFMIKIKEGYEPIFNDVDYTNDQIYKYILSRFRSYQYSPEIKMSGFNLSYIYITLSTFFIC